MLEVVFFLRHILVCVRDGKPLSEKLLFLDEQIDFMVKMVQLFVVMLVGIESNYSLNCEEHNSSRNNQYIVRSNMSDPAIDFAYHVYPSFRKKCRLLLFIAFTIRKITWKMFSNDFIRKRD